VSSANVLMPKLLVKRYWGRGPRTLTSIATRFEVSTQAMSYRLRQLGLTDAPERCAWQTDIDSTQQTKGRWTTQLEAA